jgi:hypothetical protein
MLTLAFVFANTIGPVPLCSIMFYSLFTLTFVFANTIGPVLLCSIMFYSLFTLTFVFANTIDPRYALSSQGNDTAYGDHMADVTDDGTLSRTKTTGKTKRKKISFSPYDFEPTSTGSDASDKWIHPQPGTTVAGEHDVRAVSPHTQRSDANLHPGGDVRRLAEVSCCAHCNVFDSLAQF